MQAVSRSKWTDQSKRQTEKRPIGYNIKSTLTDVFGAFFRMESSVKKEREWVTQQIASVFSQAKSFHTNEKALQENFVFDVFNKSFDLVSQLLDQGKISGASIDPMEGLTVFVDDIFSDDADRVIDVYYEWLDKNRNGCPISFEMKNKTAMERYQSSYLVFNFSK